MTLPHAARSRSAALDRSTPGRPSSSPTLLRLLAASFACLGLAVARAQAAPSDVPAGHWARAAVLSVVSKGVMGAPNGRFDGARKVDRREMVAILARYAKALQAGKWTKGQAKPLRAQASSVPVERGDRAITRYEFAAALDRTGPYVAAGLPRTGSKVYGKSEIIPPAASLKGVSRTDPAYAPLTYLVRNRMLWAPCALLKPGPQPVTGTEAADAIGMLIVRVNDLATDEPQNHEDLGPPPSKGTAPRRPTGPPPTPATPPSGVGPKPRAPLGPGSRT